MGLPAMSPADGVAWVTGASSGLGRGTALELARRGWRVFATARREDALRTLAEEARDLAGSITPAPADVTDSAGLAALVASIEAQAPIALAFLNAGGSYAERGEPIGGPGFQRTFAVNVQGIANAAGPVFAAMKARGKGQIAVMASLAAYGVIAGDFSYAPSKAAARTFAEALHLWGKRVNIRVQLVSPGFVKTELTAGLSLPPWMVLELDDASRRIVDGFARGGFEIAFPRRMAWPLKLAGALPYPLYFALYGRSARRRPSAKA